MRWNPLVKLRRLAFRRRRRRRRDVRADAIFSYPWLVKATSTDWAPIQFRTKISFTKTFFRSAHLHSGEWQWVQTSAGIASIPLITTTATRNFVTSPNFSLFSSKVIYHSRELSVGHRSCVGTITGHSNSTANDGYKWLTKWLVQSRFWLFQKMLYFNL